VKVGDIVRLVKAPQPALPEESRVLWNECLGKTFAITLIEDGVVEIEVRSWEERGPNGETVFCSDCFYLNPDEFELVDPSNWPVPGRP
jgi:hypothetical protein